MMKEGREEVKWELGFALFWAGKMGFTALGLGFNHLERMNNFENGRGILIFSAL